MQEKELFSSEDEFLIGQVCSILKEKGIPFIKREAGAGAYIGVIWGKSNTTKTIYVSEEDFEKAQEAIEIISSNENAGEIPEELKESTEEKEETAKAYKNYSMPRKIFGVMIGVFFATLILIWIIQMVIYLKN